MLPSNSKSHIANLQWNLARTQSALIYTKELTNRIVFPTTTLLKADWAKKPSYNVVILAVCALTCVL